MKRADPEPIELDPRERRAPKERRANRRQELTGEGIAGTTSTTSTTSTASTPVEPGSRSVAGSRGASSGPSSFAGHYGQLIISEGVAPIPRALFLYQGALQLSPQQVWFVSCVLAHKWDADLPHPSLQEIARHATLSLRQVKKIKSSVVQAGLLEVRPRYGADGEQDANSYDFGLLFEALERIMLADRAAPPDELGEEAPGGDRGRIERSGRVSGADSTAATGATSPPHLTLDAGGERAKDYSFAARFGRVLLRRGIATLPRALFTYQSRLGLSPQQMWFVGYILSFQWSTELPYPSLRKMASNTGYSERQIHRIKDSLVGSGYLRVVGRRATDGADTTSAYDFTAMLKTLNELISKGRKGGRQGAEQQLTAAGRGQREEMEMLAGRAGPQRAPQVVAQHFGEVLKVGGEVRVSGGVHPASVEGEPGVSGRVNEVSGGGVNSMSVAGVNRASYEIESDKEEPDKEEADQQQAVELDEGEENAYFALVDVGVMPAIALELAAQAEPEQILDWVRYYLSVLARQENLSNPLGVLVSRLRSGAEPPSVPSPGDLQSLRLKLSRYR